MFLLGTGDDISRFVIRFAIDVSPPVLRGGKLTSLNALNSTLISSQELAEIRKAGKRIELIDVRTPVEYREVHVEFAQNIPLDQLDPQAVMQARNGSQGEPLYFVCRAGSRGEKACDKFRQAGYTNVVNVDGGTSACEQTGLPLVRGKKAISLERQVRIAAGALVLLGAVLSWLVHPALIGLSAFVGAGLIFAGITDTCGMGVLLARMPWNGCSLKCTSCMPAWNSRLPIAPVNCRQVRSASAG